jgi:hypothetical protein
MRVLGGLGRAPRQFLVADDVPEPGREVARAQVSFPGRIGHGPRVSDEVGEVPRPTGAVRAVIAEVEAVRVADIAEGIFPPVALVVLSRGADLDRASPARRPERPEQPLVGRTVRHVRYAVSGLTRELRDHAGRRRSEREQEVGPPQHLGGNPLRVDRDEHRAREVIAPKVRIRVDTFVATSIPGASNTSR